MVRFFPGDITNQVNRIGSSHREGVLKVLPWEGGIVRQIIPEGNVPAINKKGQRPSNLTLTLHRIPVLEDVSSNAFVIDLAVQPLLWVLPSATRYLNQAPGLDRSAAIQRLLEEG